MTVVRTTSHQEQPSCVPGRQAGGQGGGQAGGGLGDRAGGEGWGCSGPVPAARGGYAGAVTMAIACASAAAPGIQALNSGPEFRPGIQAWAGAS